MKRFLLILFFAPGVIAGIIFLMGWDEDIVYAYRDYKHDKWLKEWLPTAESTAAANAFYFKDTINIDYLDEKRDVAVFLPEGYENDDSTRYPVIYFFDGDNLFDQRVAESPDEWQVDEVINEGTRKGGPAAIVIGVRSSENDRMTEYKPYETEFFNDNKPVSGQAHMEWFATDLKAWVDSRYRTLDGPENTTLGGCSLGGLMAYYGVMTYPKIYGRGIIFSPSFWTDIGKMGELHKNHPDLASVRLFVNAGELETPTVNDAKTIRDKLFADGFKEENMYFDVEPGEGHWHATWIKGFKKAYPWILE